MLKVLLALSFSDSVKYTKLNSRGNSSFMNINGLKWKTCIFSNTRSSHARKHGVARNEAIEQVSAQHQLSKPFALSGATLVPSNA